ncbi:hypothetical protein ABFV05_015966 [Capra hircus]
MLRGAQGPKGSIVRLGVGDRALTQDATGTHLHVPARGELDKFRDLARPPALLTCGPIHLQSWSSGFSEGKCEAMVIGDEEDMETNQGQEKNSSSFIEWRPPETTTGTHAVDFSTCSF